MQYQIDHHWPADKAEAFEIQKDLFARLRQGGNRDIPQPERIAAVETAYGAGGDRIYAAAVVVSFPELEPIERAYYHLPVEFQYVPGLAYFREGPVILRALAKLQEQPDVLMVHGHGLAHPRQCGIASLIGLAFDIPSVGCARRILAGNYRPVGETKGSSQPIYLRDKLVGVAYRSKDNVKPIFISPGFLYTLDQSQDITVRCLRGYRQPEPLRLAHLFVNKYKRRIEKGHHSDQGHRRRPRENANTEHVND